MASTVGNTDDPYNAFLFEGIKDKQVGRKGRIISTNGDMSTDFQRMAQFRDNQDYIGLL